MTIILQKKEPKRHHSHQIMMTSFYLLEGKVMAPPRAISPAPPRRDSLLGASCPNLMAEAMASLGSEKPSWAQRKGRISSSGKLLMMGMEESFLITTLSWKRGRMARGKPKSGTTST